MLNSAMNKNVKKVGVKMQSHRYESYMDLSLSPSPSPSPSPPPRFENETKQNKTRLEGLPFQLCPRGSLILNAESPHVSTDVKPQRTMGHSSYVTTRNQAFHGTLEHKLTTVSNLREHCLPFALHYEKSFYRVCAFLFTDCIQ